ncbi:unnamed protein product [Cuscuta epithymum]|uniref:Hexosyltransferase n=2 Tax=Cuscuta epithymum TaxID=186058 RepID=A0AAV0GEV7_9ASTE|nr:unnamed protein product [Cuscuta epithymum]
MEARLRSADDVHKRKLQKIKVEDVVKPFQQPFQEKSTRLKLHHLKLLLFVLVIATFIILLATPNGCSRYSSSQPSNKPHLVKRWWIWGVPDPRYISDLVVNWDEVSIAVNELAKSEKIIRTGLLNFDEDEIRQWKLMIPEANHTVLHLDHVEQNVTWETLYPEWIDEEQMYETPSCPSLPKLDVPRKPIDLIAVKLPCKGNWTRDVARLHLQLATAGLASSAKGTRPVHLLFLTRCFPIPNLFTCQELVARKGNIWLYKPNLNVMRQKLQLPVGSCELALPFGATGVLGEPKREAYATILHSAYVYVCGAIAAAQSIRMAGSTRDLVILVDNTISEYHRSGLAAAGWQVRTIERIRNPKAEKDAYNEWNYSKFRLWQLTDYEKIIFIDADLLILRNMDFLFGMPEISATGNNGTLFNSGVMVIEPSNCTFQLLMDHINEIESYNGGDQGYLNEIFTWWHRIPKHMNFLKHFWIGDEPEVKQRKTELFAAEPPILYAVHYLGYKPWLCYRDYDCNWNVDILQEFASDAAHDKWWRVHDSMEAELQDLCLLRSKQKAQLEWDRRQAAAANYGDGHWKTEIRDQRQKRCTDRLCDWKSMLRHWGEKNWTYNPYFHPSPPLVKLRSRTKPPPVSSSS